eukprot:7387740-Prymnesium_polylepis.1
MPRLHRDRTEISQPPSSPLASSPRRPRRKGCGREDSSSQTLTPRGRLWRARGSWQRASAKSAAGRRSRPHRSSQNMGLWRRPESGRQGW